MAKNAIALKTITTGGVAHNRFTDATLEYKLRRLTVPPLDHPATTAAAETAPSGE